VVIPFKGWGKILQEAVHSLNQHSIDGAVSPIARIHGSRNQGVGMGIMAPLAVTPRDPLAKVLLPVPVSLCSIGS